MKLTGGTATSPSVALAAGGHTVQTDYSDSAGNFSTSTGTLNGGQVVKQNSTTTALTADPILTVFGQPVTFTATVTVVVPGAGTPTGTVTFEDGSNPLGTGTLNASGMATLTVPSTSPFIPALAVGTHSITASYGGDTNDLGSTGTLSGDQMVNQVSTITTLTSNPNPSVYGQSVTFTARVEVVAPGAGTPTGTVTFKDGATVLGTGTLNASGLATFTTSTLAVGNHSITASYGGDTNDLTSTGTLTGRQTVNQSQTTTSVSTVLTTSLIDHGAVVPFGQPMTLTATVTADAPSTAVPTGTVDFLDGVTNLGTGTLNNVGTATFTTSTLAAGVYRSIKAVYSGDGTNFAGSTAALEQISIIIPVAGTGIAGFGGDGGPASQAQLNQPEGVAVDASGNLYIADTDNNRIRKISPNGIITTVAGTGIAGFSGDGGPASQAQLNQPEGVAVDAPATSTSPIPATTGSARSAPTASSPPSRALG